MERELDLGDVRAVELGVPQTVRLKPRGVNLVPVEAPESWALDRLSTATRGVVSTHGFAGQGRGQASEICGSIGRMAVGGRWADRP